ncbi:MAG: hypothetical protein H8E55_09320 [Pelagibacterales bacterium]|nr:hypothetical protein [Pelagibacterales bacterium]
MISKYRRNKRNFLRGGGAEPSFAEGGSKPTVNTHFEHNEPPSSSESVRQQQAGAQSDADMQMAMNQTGGNKEQEGGDYITVPQSGAASPEGNNAMAQSAAMLMQSRQNAPANTDAPKVGGRKKKRTRRINKRRRKRTKKKRRRIRKRKTKSKYKFARKYRQKGCSRKSCKKR